MAKQFNELIKDFNMIRPYARDFYINGFKQREDFNTKSLRSYDNERRRIESYLRSFIDWEQTLQGKSMRIDFNPAEQITNPFFSLWRTKSFTKNDIFLHFVLLDCLSTEAVLSLTEITKLIDKEYLVQFDDAPIITEATIRNKLKEYCHLGILLEIKKANRTFYQKKTIIKLPEMLSPLLHFYKEISPGGVLGQVLLDHMPQKSESPFKFKHNFVIHSLDDVVVLNILKSIQNQNQLFLNQFSGKQIRVIPLKLYVSTETGRQYLIAQLLGPNLLSAIRIDTIKEVFPEDTASNYQEHLYAFEKKRNRSWNGSFNQQRSKKLAITLQIKAGREDYLVQRLIREQRSGRTQRVDENTVIFTIQLIDLYAINPFLRTFTGRILTIETNDLKWKQRFIHDMQQLIDLYTIKKSEVPDE